MAEVLIMQVVRVKYCRGLGKEDDPCRIVTEYFDMEGNQLAQHDPYKEMEIGEASR